MSSKIKVYELAKELGQDSQHLVDVIQRLGIDIKNPMSVLGTEEVRNIREYYRKQRPLTQATTKAVEAKTAPGKSPITEKRVGATVIRRRAKTAADPVEVQEAPPEEVQDLVVQETEASAEAAQMLEAEAEVYGAAAHQEAQSEEISEEAVEAAEAETEAPKPTMAPPPLPMINQTVGSIPVVVKPRRSYPSIIKKVGTEQYLGEKVGPKPPPTEKKEVKPGTAKPGAPKTGTDLSKPGMPKRVQEIELVSPEVAKETKKRLVERQSTVFKSADFLKRELVHSTKKKKTVINRPAMKTILTTPAEHKRVVIMGATITVANLAKEMGVKGTAVVGKLMSLGAPATLNQNIDHDTASLVAHEFQYEVKQEVFKEESYVPVTDVSPEKMLPRAPVVTIMGHVDHGKTSLLDAIRKTKVAAGEAGGITQHVGAYTVQLPKGKIAFIDTPGHEAFTAMRARGAKVTDIVIVVVSAVDGVMPQTTESINHAKAGNVPIIVAVNKVDLPDGNPDRIKTTLAGQGLNPEEWGGDTMYVPVSAKTGIGIDKLLETILLQADMLELKANFDAPARGTIVESKLDKNRGPVATVLVQQGKLRPGDHVACGTTFGKIRAMTNSLGQRVLEAGPSDPVEILGLPEVPNTGDELFAVTDEKTARELTEQRRDIHRIKTLEPQARQTLDDLLNAPVSEGELKIILKTDVQGSAEALQGALAKFPSNKVQLKVLHAGTGQVTESDVMLAAASKAVILGFNVKVDGKAQKIAEVENVSLKTYGVIYELLDDVKGLLEGLLTVSHKDKVIGRAEVRSVFHIPRIGTIAGSAVTDGKVQRGCFMRLLRDSRVVYEGKISSLKRFKEDVREVAQGFECGIGLEGFNDLKNGDQFEAFIREEVKGVL